MVVNVLGNYLRHKVVCSMVLYFFWYVEIQALTQFVISDDLLYDWLFFSRLICSLLGKVPNRIYVFKTVLVWHRVSYKESEKMHSCDYFNGFTYFWLVTISKSHDRVYVTVIWQLLKRSCSSSLRHLFIEVLQWSAWSVCLFITVSQEYIVALQSAPVYRCYLFVFFMLTLWYHLPGKLHFRHFSFFANDFLKKKCLSIEL